MNKLFYTSKAFWTGIAGIFTSIGFLMSGEITTGSFVAEIMPAILGILSIIFRWNVDTKLGIKK